MTKESGMNYAPKGKPNKVCAPGEFLFAAIGLDHGHIYGMCNGLIEAGAELKYVYDPDKSKVETFCKTYPGVIAAATEEIILADPKVNMVASAAIPSERCNVGLRAMYAGKDYFVDKAPLTTLEQLQAAKKAVAQTGKKYAVYYCERLHNESAVYAGQLISEDAIGRVIHVMGLGPHRIGSIRPNWFYDDKKFGGILCDIGSHQIEQFLFYTGAKDATITGARIANYSHKEHVNFQDFGDANLVGNNGATGYFRVDWYTPDGLGTWGDGRTFIQGTKGYIELRKYIDIARDTSCDNVYLVNNEGEFHKNVSGEVGFPFFGELILDCINRTENAMTQEHAFKAAELCVKLQNGAKKIE